MSERERDEHSGVETTGHEWDGIKELDNPLPRWWLWVFYGSIAVAVVYWVMMPAWPGLRGYTPGLMKQSDRVDLVEQLDALQAQRGRGEAMLMSASLEQIEADPDLQAHALAVGQSVFGDNCASCHGVGGGGAKGRQRRRQPDHHQIRGWRGRPRLRPGRPAAAFAGRADGPGSDSVR